MDLARLDRARLEERILNLLATQNMCVLATVGPSGPLATPVRYFSSGLSLAITVSPRSPKVRNLRTDPRASIGVFAPLAGPSSSRGAQLFGVARVLTPDDPSQERFVDLVPPDETLVVLDPDRIVYTDHWLPRSGFAARQFWSRSL